MAAFPSKDHRIDAGTVLQGSTSFRAGGYVGNRRKRAVSLVGQGSGTELLTGLHSRCWGLLLTRLKPVPRTKYHRQSAFFLGSLMGRCLAWAILHLAGVIVAAEAASPLLSECQLHVRPSLSTSL